MATDCYTQLGFGFQPKLVVDFAGGTLTTDAGLLLVREFDEQLGLSADVVGRITDTRDARYVTHELDARLAKPVITDPHKPPRCPPTLRPRTVKPTRPFRMSSTCSLREKI